MSASRNPPEDAAPGPDTPPDPLATDLAATAPAGGPPADWPAVPGYEILEPLAPGGMGMVFRARQTDTDRMVALKVIRAGVHAEPQERARFRVEAEAVAALAHPHVIRIYDHGEWAGLPYLAMEFAEGGSLAQRLEAGPLPPGQAAELVETLARAVQFVHEHGIIHRDLKPANILLQKDEGGGRREEDERFISSLLLPPSSFVLKIADFGLAKRLDHDQGLTRTQSVLGTASYMAPEQAAGDKRAVGPAADVYALGAILYEALTGQPPFRAETRELTIHQVLSEEPRPPAQLRPDVPPELEAVCLKCLEKKPARRYASAAELADDLRRYRDGQPLSVRSLDAFDRHRRLARRAGYEVEDFLGAGAAGLVYKARHGVLKRTVALTLLAPRGHDPARLRAAAEAAARLHHPNIVGLYDFGECDGQPYVAWEYVEGKTLAGGWPGDSQPAEQTAALVEALARAAHHAHLAGLVHGGLRPSKVFLAADGACKISGFGLANVWPRERSAGALRYAAPEQAGDAAGPPGPAADVYGLGAVLYDLLTGRPPVAADAAGARPEPPRHWRPEVPAELEAICLTCLEPEPARRYPSAAALAEDLRRFRSGEVLFIDDLDDWSQQKRWARRAGYEILEVHGQSPDGFAYKARQVALDRVVFLKRVAARHRFDPEAKLRFRREAYLLARLRHPGFVQLYDQGEQNDLCYFAREFVDGPGLAERLPDGPDPAELVEALARAVHAAHLQRVVHGGLHPGVVRLTPAGVPKVTGLRRTRPADEPDDTRPESERRRLACYLAPEQLGGAGRMFDRAVDVYALGAILYALLTGQPPFPGPTLAETLEQVRSLAPTPPRQLRPDVPAELETICLQCLEKEPGRRPSTAQALADALQALLVE